MKTSDTTFYYYVDCWGREGREVEQHECYMLTDTQPFYNQYLKIWDYETLVQACAEDYHSNHDGWDHKSWPDRYMPFWLFDVDMNLVGVYNVLLEYEPTFYAEKKHD